MKQFTEAGPHISLFLPSLAGGGAERIFINLATEFLTRGYRTDIVLATAIGEYIDRVPQGVRIIDLNASRPFTAIPALVSYLLRERPGVLLSTITNANIAAILATKIARIPIRCIVREASTLSVELAHSTKINKIILPYLMRWTFAQVHAIIAPSFGVADDLSKVTGICRESVQVIYNPIISTSLLKQSQQPVQHPWLHLHGTPVIIGMGRLTSQKDFATLIEAFALIRKKISAKLILLGDGEERESLKGTAKRLGIVNDVDIMGFVSNPYPFLSRATLFVLSSRWEGLPGVLIEALACGTQVISTDCPSGPREILDNGIYGQLVPIADPIAMSVAIENAINGKFRAADPSQWIKKFSVEWNTKIYLNTLFN